VRKEALVRMLSSWCKLDHRKAVTEKGQPCE
jgi:hypothetical protein